MPHSLTIDPPRIPSNSNHLDQPQQQSFSSYNPDSPGDESPTAPEYSPITPKIQPALPVTALPTATTSFVPPDHGGTFNFSMSEQKQQAQHPQQHPHHPAQPAPFAPVSDHSHLQQTPTINSSTPETKDAPPTYIPQPPNKPFSGDDASDAIALRAAISTLQFQRRKAQDDLKALARIKALALEDPRRFQAELASGKLKEQRLTMGDLQAILDQSDSDDEDDDDDMETEKGEGDEGDATSGAQATGAEAQAEIPDSQPSEAGDPSARPPQPYPSIPGPQTVVRMPYVNWDKYGIVGEPLDAMHAQQQRWPGHSGSDRGREYTPAAPYSPFLDHLEGCSKIDGDTGSRKDSAAAAATATTPTGTVSEHPMETRSRT